MKWALLTLVVLGVADAQQALSPDAWTQPAGGWGRTSIVRVQLPPLDVVSSYAYAAGASPDRRAIGALGPAGMYETPHGIVAVLDDGETCGLLWIEDVETGATRTGPPHACTGARYPRGDGLSGGAPFVDEIANAYVASIDAVLVCVTSPLAASPIQAWRAADGEVLWKAQIAGTPRETGDFRCAGLTDEAAGVSYWSLYSYQYPVAGFGTNAGSSSAVAVDIATGRVLWRTQVGDPIDVEVSPLGVTSPEDPASRLVPIFPALTPTGLVFPVFHFDPRIVTGSQAGPSVGAVWLDREGRIVGSDIPGYGADGRRVVTGVSEWAATQENLAALVIGSDVVLVDTTTAVPRRIADVEPRGSAEFAPPAWWQNILLVPSDADVRALDPTTGETRWTWSATGGAFVYQVAIAPPNEALVLGAVASANGTRTVLYRLGLADGKTLQALPLPGLDQPVNPGLFVLQFIPTTSPPGLFVYSDRGRAVFLEASPEEKRPTVRVANEYPGIAEAFELTATAPAEATSIEIAWGDGGRESVAPGATVRHAYSDARPRTVRVTAHFPDGTTATTEALIRVGEPRPRDLTAIQRAFAPENQNLTFFLIGLAVTGGAALFAAAIRRQRHRRLSAEEKRLRAIIDDSMLNPTRGLAALAAHRAHLREAHMRRRLDDAQFALLDQRTVRAMRSARYRLLGPSLNELSPHFRRLLDTALEDGQVTTGEMAALVAALEDEARLGPEARARMGSLLRSWAQ